MTDEQIRLAAEKEANRKADLLDAIYADQSTDWQKDTDTRRRYVVGQTLDISERLTEALRILDQAGYAVEDRRPTHRHLKRGSTYCYVGSAEVQASEPVHEGHHLAIYRAADGTLWARPEIEFNDGRFTALSQEKGR